VYKGQSIVTPQYCREYLALADFRGFIATYDVGFNLLATSGSFKDSNLPAGYAPFNIQQIGTEVFVTYALRDARGINPVVAPGNGSVNVFDRKVISYAASFRTVRSKRPGASFRQVLTSAGSAMTS
jgi:hypothetical protein